MPAMQSLLDVLLVAVIVLFGVLGYRRGLVRSLAGVGRLILAVLVTVVLTTPVARLLDAKVMHPPVQSYVGERLASLADRAEGSVSALYDAIPAFLRAHLTESDTAAPGLDAAVERWTATISHAVSGALSSILATILVFFIALVSVRWLLRLLSRIVRAIPLVSGIDRLLGLALGGVTGVAAVALSSRMIAALLIAFGRPEWVEASRILHLLGGL